VIKQTCLHIQKDVIVDKKPRDECKKINHFTAINHTRVGNADRSLRFSRAAERRTRRANTDAAASPRESKETVEGGWEGFVDKLLIAPPESSSISNEASRGVFAKFPTWPCALNAESILDVGQPLTGFPPPPPAV